MLAGSEFSSTSLGERQYNAQRHIDSAREQSKEIDSQLQEVEARCIEAISQHAEREEKRKKAEEEMFGDEMPEEPSVPVKEEEKKEDESWVWLWLYMCGNTSIKWQLGSGFLPPPPLSLSLRYKQLTDDTPTDSFSPSLSLSLSLFLFLSISMMNYCMTPGGRGPCEQVIYTIVKMKRSGRRLNERCEEKRCPWNLLCQTRKGRRKRMTLECICDHGC